MLAQECLETQKLVFYPADGVKGINGTIDALVLDLLRKCFAQFRVFFALQYILDQFFIYTYLRYSYHDSLSMEIHS